LALALADHDVICVEADFRRPTLHRLLGVQTTRGLADVLEGKVRLGDALREVEMISASSNGGAPAPGRAEGRLRLLQAGDNASDSTGLLSMDRMFATAKELSESANYVIFDSSPLPAASETLALALNVDGVLVVARQGRTRREEAEAVRTTLEGIGATKVAVVLTDSNESVPTSAE
jgi:receptor protein-tyrosine kinase